MRTPPAVDELAVRLRALGWVGDLWLGGSAATGDYHPGVSDLDLVAVVEGVMTPAREAVICELHRDLDAGVGAGTLTGCAYVADATLSGATLSSATVSGAATGGASVADSTRHPTWTHGQLLARPLSLLTQAELVRHGIAVFGRPPREVLPRVDADDIRRAVRAELAGYWSKAVRRPWWWLDRDLADLSLTTMARARHGLATGELLTKTAAIQARDDPPWLRADLLARRCGASARSRFLRTAWIAWCDARRTVAEGTGAPTV